MNIPRRGPFPQVSVGVGANGSSSGTGSGGSAGDARNVLSPHTEEMNIMLAENIDSILGGKIEKGMGRLSLVSELLIPIQSVSRILTNIRLF